MKTRYIAIYSGDMSENGACGPRTKEIINAVLETIFRARYETKFILLFAAGTNSAFSNDQPQKQLMYEYCKWRLIASGYDPSVFDGLKDCIGEGFWNKQHRVLLQCS